MMEKETQIFDLLQEQNLLSYIKLSGLTPKQIIEAINRYKLGPKVIDDWKIKETQLPLFGEDYLD